MESTLTGRPQGPTQAVSPLFWAQNSPPMGQGQSDGGTCATTGLEVPCRLLFLADASGCACIIIWTRVTVCERVCTVPMSSSFNAMAVIQQWAECRGGRPLSLHFCQLPPAADAKKHDDGRRGTRRCQGTFPVPGTRPQQYEDITSWPPHFPSQTSTRAKHSLWSALPCIGLGRCSILLAVICTGS